VHLARVGADKGHVYFRVVVPSPDKVRGICFGKHIAKVPAFLHPISQRYIFNMQLQVCTQCTPVYGNIYCCAQCFLTGTAHLPASRLCRAEPAPLWRLAQQQTV
jgi:hypothetical protein